ncbi:hypothetical protein [Candidatus Rhabdochlamydia sp. T3358]|uniref:hypothetical protein n=1 Tax=Candidatus Rhabdochlamydia sp. T3358 TaxID=2099795 RepID=UPI0010B395A7|nr:hypothetical protein [Candidatus Rhabdochlamydia sp. T3358]VHN99537.1 hypothetical protein RHT_00039 [Candidatus Rhabdochlamydia sp. T3358]
MPNQIVFALDNKEILQQTYDFLMSHSEKSLFDLEEERVFSHLIDHSFLQMSFSFRSLFRARQLANLLIDKQGELDPKNLKNVIDFLENKGFICYPNGYSDSMITEHQIQILKQFTSQKMIKLLYRFSPPVCHKAAESLLFDSLGISAGKLHISDIRRGVLCASLNPLRQNIGSCFATAPGILVQKEQLALFLVDLYQLLSTGQLKRIYNGNEYIAAMSTTYTSMYCKQSLDERALLSPGILQALKACGVIDQKLSLEKQMQQMQTICSPLFSSCSTVTELLQKVAINQPIQKMQAAFTGLTENALLKAWEFTLASFSEADPQLVRWHLYTALGFSPEEPEGLGFVIHSCLQEKLEIYHQELEKLQKEVEITADQLRAVQGVINRADTTSRIRSFQAEYQSLSHHLQACIDRREQLISEANDLSSLFSIIIQYYLDQFSHYFQEVYDPQLVSISDEDSPAGFRLFYKHGRTNASLWTAIETEKEFNQSLRDFFLATESLLFVQAKEQKVITEIVAAIVLHLHQRMFFLNVQKRMKSKEPWCYISGGTMQTLVQNYFCTDKVTLEQRVVESPLELLIFLLDTLKEIPNVTRTMLMNSPVHAFLLLPSEPLFKQGWQDNGFTYTWIRDVFIHPGVQFYQQMLLTPPMQQYLLQQLSPSKINYPLQTPKEFRDQTLDAFPQITPDDIDAFLYQQLPLIPSVNCKEYLQKLLFSVLTPKIQEIIEQFSLPKTAFISAEQMKKIAKSCLLLAQNSIGFSFDVHNFITDAACEIGLSPRCLIFADTNWPGFYFGFVINPGTQDLELWRFDASCSLGYPMSSWKKWLGSENKPWTVYVKPSEYLFPLHSYGV